MKLGNLDQLNAELKRIFDADCRVHDNVVLAEGNRATIACLLPNPWRDDSLIVHMRDASYPDAVINVEGAGFEPGETFRWGGDRVVHATEVEGETETDDLLDADEDDYERDTTLRLLKDLGEQLLERAEKEGLGLAMAIDARLNNLVSPIYALIEHCPLDEDAEQLEDERFVLRTLTRTIEQIGHFKPDELKTLAMMLNEADVRRDMECLLR